MGRAVLGFMPYGSGWYVRLWYEMPDHGQNRMPCFASLKPLLDNNDNHLTTSEPLSELRISGEVTHPVRRPPCHHPYTTGSATWREALLGRTPPR